MNNLMNNDYLLRKVKILQDSGISPDTQKVIQPQQGQQSFEEILSKINNNQELKFSKHALERIKSRNINLTPQEITQISNAVDLANSKGVKEALILMNDKAFIASVKSRTIITAASEDQLKENVFTNIDGAVIL